MGDLIFLVDYLVHIGPYFDHLVNEGVEVTLGNGLEIFDVLEELHLLTVFGHELLAEDPVEGMLVEDQEVRLYGAENGGGALLFGDEGDLAERVPLVQLADQCEIRICMGNKIFDILELLAFFAERLGLHLFESDALVLEVFLQMRFGNQDADLAFDDNVEGSSLVP